MLVTLDLTTRQAARVLAQAVRQRATVELEPRPETHNALLWGHLVGRQDHVLLVDLHDTGHQISLAGLTGAMCDVRTILSGQLCLFSTHILDAVDQGIPQRLVVAVPDTIQVANRRRFARKQPHESIPVRLLVPGGHPPLVGTLVNIGASGLACRATGPTLDELLLIGDEVDIEFVLPWAADIYTLPAIVCSKSRDGDEGLMTVGFEFVNRDNEQTLTRLRAAISHETARLTEMDGEQ